MIQGIKVLFVDLDGTLTDGKYIISNNGVVTKTFYTRDFYGLQLLAKSGIHIVVLTQASDGVGEEQVARIKKCWGEHGDKIDIYGGVHDKYKFLCEFVDEENIDVSTEGAYIGDAENDIECMAVSRFVGCPNDAEKIVIDNADYISTKCGGNGAVYDICKYMESLEEF